MTEERRLIWFLRFSALMFLAAAPAVVMPTEWMDLTAGWFGLAKLPDVPLMGYLTRRLSALSACMGATYWFLSGDVRRYLPLLRFAAPLTLALGAITIAIDRAVEMPLVWMLGEGVSIFAWSLALWWLVRRLQSA